MYQRTKEKNKLVYQVGKRLFDIVFSLIVLIALLPFLLAVALLIFLNDPNGSPFYVHTRIGKDGKPFRMIKFRTMFVNAEAMLDALRGQNERDKIVFKIKDDPRITGFGKHLRRYSIDELPQFVNVLLGSMSVVGPRPPVPEEVEEYNELQMRRLSVKPGLTCYWQIMPQRYSCGFDDWVASDLEYIEDRSFRTDLQIIGKTVKCVFYGSGE